MSPTNSLVEGTLQEAVEVLAKLASYRRVVPASYADREKVANTDFLSGIGEQMKKNPMLAQTLIGTAAGAGIGGIGTAIGNMGRKDRDRKSVWGNAMTGALAGAGLGAGVGAIRSGFGGLGSANPGVGMEDVKGGRFSFGGKNFAITPEALKKNPGLVDEVRSINGPRPLPEQAVTGTIGALGALGQAAPITSGLLPYVGAADLALHAPGVGLARIRPDQAAGRLGREILMHGVTSTDAGKALPEPIRQTILGGKNISNDTAVAPHERGLLGKLFKRDPIAPTAPGSPDTTIWGRIKQRLGYGSGTTGETSARDWLTQRRAGNANPDANVLQVTERTPVMEKVEHNTGGGKRGRGGAKTVFEQQRRYPAPAGSPPGTLGAPVETVKTHRMTGAERAQVMQQGAASLGRTAGRNLYRLPFTNMTYTGMGSTARALGLRAALYGAPMLGEYAIRSYGSELGRQRRMDEIIQGLRDQGVVREVPQSAGGGH